MAHQPKSQSDLLRENAELRSQLEEAEEALRAIRNGEVDALVLPGGPEGVEIYTLKSADHSYRVLVEEMQEGAAVVSTDGSILYCNRRFAEIVRTPLERVIGSPVCQIIPDEQWETCEKLLHDALRDRAAKGEFHIVSPDAERVPVYLSASAMKVDGRDAVALIATDLTEQKRSEQLDAANKAKDQFLAMLSHELRTPLSPVMTAVHLMQTDQTLSPEMREWVSIIHRNVELEARLIDDLLDLTRISKGKVELRFDTIDAHACLSATLDMIREEIDHKSLRLTTHLSADAFHVRADRARMQQVFWNLLKNAVKFTPSGGEIRVTSRKGPDGRMIIEISDTGIGIEPANLSILFNAFEQGERSVTRRFGGLGLGLTISKALIEMQQGTLFATSAGPEQGSTFTIEMATVPVGEPLPVPDPSIESSETGRRILLVEDDRDTRDVLARMLRRIGHHVVTAANVAEAMKSISGGEFDLLISDLGLPDGSGLDIVRHLKANGGCRTRAIVLSGYGMDEDLRKSREAGFEQHLTKPINFAALEAMIR